MIYEIEKCPVCGSSSLKVLSRTTVGKDVVLKYSCVACGAKIQNKDLFVKKENSISAIDIFNSSLNSVIEILTDFNSISSSGTGILLRNNYVITNAHLLMSNGEIAKEIYGNFAKSSDSFVLDIISIDDDLDIALLKLNGIEYAPMKLKEVVVNTGESVYAVGNAIGQGLTIVEGIISDSNRRVNDKDYILHSTLVNHGNSGGPLFNSNGEMIGMISSTRKDAKSMSYAIPNKTIISFLKEQNIL